MKPQTEVMTVAGERADKRIDSAIGALKKAAAEVAKQFEIPENVSGHTPAELLGRIAYVPSMARDLRRALGEALRKVELHTAFGPQAVTTDSPLTPTAPPQQTELTRIPELPTGMDLAKLPGVPVQTVKALRAAGLNTVGDVAQVPDEHLLKISGVADRSVQQIRAAIAKLMAPTA